MEKNFENLAPYINRTNRLIICTLLAVFVIFVFPTKAKALEELYSLSFSTVLNDASITVFRNSRGGIVRLTDESSSRTFMQGSGYKQYSAEANPNWVFETFEYSLKWKGTERYNRQDISGAYTFSKTHSNKQAAYIYGGSTISLNRLLTLGETTFNPLKYEIVAHFNPTIKAIANTGGTISFAGQNPVKYGSSRTFNISSNAGKRIKYVLVDSRYVLEAEGQTQFSYEFNNIVDYHVIYAGFEDIPPTKYDINANASPVAGGYSCWSRGL